MGTQDALCLNDSGPPRALCAMAAHDTILTLAPKPDPTPIVYHRPTFRYFREQFFNTFEIVKWFLQH